MKTRKSMGRFTLIWFGQLVSTLGSGISTFGLGIWVFDKTGSASKFAFTFLFTMLPRIILSPIAGSVADRKNRKKIIIITDVLDAVLKLLIVTLFITGRFEVWMTYPFSFLSATLGAFQSPAFRATIPLIVPKEYLGRAHGMRQFTYAMNTMLKPVLGAVLYMALGLAWLFIIDFATFFVAIIIMLFQKIPQVYEKSEHPNFYRTIIADFKFSVQYLKNKTGYVQLILSITVLNFFANAVLVLLGPLVMANYDKATYGLVMAVDGGAMVVGGFLASVLPDVKKKVRAVYLSKIISSIGILMMGISANWLVIVVGLFLFSVFVPHINRLFGTLEQLKIENFALGRVGAISGALAGLVNPLATICAGLLADNVFIPMFEDGGSLSGTWLDAMLGSGNNRGVGFMLIICAVLSLLVCVAMLFNKSVMRFEIDNPDVIED